MQPAERRRAVWSVYLVGAIDCADAALLPGCFRSLETEMALRPSTLAALVLAQSVAGALACPAWGYVVDAGGWERRDLLVLGCCWWAAASVLSALALGFWSLLLARTLLGVALPLVSPLSQSIIADLFDEKDRGKAFGASAMWCTVGTALGGIGGTALSNHRVPFLGASLAGWRAVFLIGALCCAVVAAQVAWCCPAIPRTGGTGTVSKLAQDWRTVARAVGRNRTWQLLTAQSLFGGLPFAGFHFLTLLMQYAGYQDAVAAVLLGAHRFGSAAGSLLGGHIGDAVAAAGYNRVRVAQGSVAWLLVFLLILISALEQNVLARNNPTATGGGTHTGGDATSTPVAPLMLAAILFMWGLGGSFCEVGCDLPILAEVAATSDGVSSNRASMIAYKRAVQGVINPLGAPIVGMLAEHVYGYRPTTESVAALEPLHRSTNALALGSSLRTLALLCWPVCFVGYGTVGRHYAQHQRQVAYAQQSGDRERQLTELRAQLQNQNELQDEMQRTQAALLAAKRQQQQQQQQQQKYLR